MAIALFLVSYFRRLSNEVTIPKANIINVDLKAAGVLSIDLG